MRFFRVTLPITLAFVMAVVAIASQFVSHHYSNNFIQETTVWSRVIGGITMFIGAYSLLRVHYVKIKRQQKGWGYSGLLYVFFALMVFFGILNFGIRPVESIKALPAEKAFPSVTATTKPDAQAAAAAGATTQPQAPGVGVAGATTQPQAPGVAVAGATTQPVPPGVLALADASGKPFTDDQGSPLFCAAGSVPATGETVRALTDAKKKPLTAAGGKPLYVDIRTGQVTDIPPTGFLGPLSPKTTLKEGTRWIYEAVQWPAGSTQYSLLGFFICSAAFRTFRAKTVEAGVLLVAALIVMLGQVPISAMIWEKIPVVSGLLLDVPNMAVKRAIMFGICVGSVGTALRVMFGIERSYMGGD